MSYLVLARKYRPQRFEELVGQEHVARTLANAIELGRVHHAFLFTGPRGVGKTSAARILARALCCAEGPTAAPCGKCDFCAEITSGQSVDVLEIDGASNTGVDHIRELREGARYLPARARKKVYIVDEVHMLSTSAFNALLKTLEEPPEHVVFILATTEVHKIPATILSRTQRYDFKLISTGVLADHLRGVFKAEKIKADEDAVRLLARQAAGSVRDMLSLADQVIAFVGKDPIGRARVAEILGVADRRLCLRLAEAVLARKVGDALTLLAEAADGGVDGVQLARAFLAVLHDIDLAGLVADPASVIDASPEEVAELQALHKQAPRGLVAALFDRWARAVEEASRSSAPRLHLEMAAADLCATEPLLPLGDLLARLEELEGRLGRADGAGASGSGPAGGARGGGAAGRPGAAPPAAAGWRAAPPAGAAPAAGAPGSAASSMPTSAPPARAGGGARPAGPEDGWRELRERLAEIRPTLAAALDHAELAAWGADRVVVFFPDRFSLEQVEKGRAEIERLLQELIGARPTLILRQGTAGADAIVGSQVARENEAAAGDRQRRKQEAEQHPMIEKARSLFGAKIEEIKTP